jgi:hypothetical protein
MTTMAQARLRGADLWAGLCVAAVGVVGLVASFDIFVPTGLNDYLGPRAFPITISSVLIVFGVTLAVRSLVRSSPASADLGSLSTLAVMCGAVAGYLLVFNALGYTLATTLLLAALFVYLGERRIWLACGAALLLAVATMYLFATGLNVNLPSGPLGF